MIVRTIDENILCFCKHPWEDHHHGCVMNPEYYDYPLTIRGCIGQECEWNQVNGQYFLRKGEKKYCKCDSFRPSSKYIQRLVKEWQDNHPRR